MHAAWKCEDIRYLIFKGLPRSDLPQLARTCKDLFDTATDELWKTATSILPLLSLLPPDARRRPLLGEDLQRLDLYAAKIKNLCLENKKPGSKCASTQLPPEYNPARKPNRTGSEGKLWGALWSEIAELRPPKEFMPNLHHLHFVNASEALLVPLVGITGVKLQQIYIKSVQNLEPESVVQQFLEHLHETPELEYIFVQDGEQLIPPRIIREAPIKTFRLDPRNLRPEERENFRPPPELLGSSMFGLEKLTLGLTPGWYTPELDKFIGRKYLPGLKSLWLNLVNISPQPCKPECPKQEPGKEGSWFCTHQLTDGTLDQSKRSPAIFLDGLDSPKLQLLRINFPQEANGQLVLDVVKAVKNSCQLINLTGLALTGGNSIIGKPTWRHNRAHLTYIDCKCQPRNGLNSLPCCFGIRLCSSLQELLGLEHSTLRYISKKFTNSEIWDTGEIEAMCNRRQLDLQDPRFRARHALDSNIKSTELREALTLLLPLPFLTTLQLSVAPSFLGHLDLNIYKSITDGLPALTTLSIGHAFSFRSDRIFLRPLAAFCSMHPNLEVLNLGTVDIEQPQETPATAWKCPSVNSLNVAHWYNEGPHYHRPPSLLRLALETYFPSANRDYYVQ